MAITRRDQKLELSKLASNPNTVRLISLLAQAAGKGIRAAYNASGSSSNTSNVKSDGFTSQAKPGRKRKSGPQKKVQFVRDGELYRIPGNFINARKQITFSGQELTDVKGGGGSH